ncbi:MAG: hypothetical protein QME65_03660 [Candidatus Omnitrophota bacterium]|nr:hypothetical protein [Candidatus Omnitrophota bacterium]
MKSRIRKILSLVLSLGLLLQQTSFAQVAVELNIADHLSILGNRLITERFRPLHLRYFSYDALNDNFRMLVDKGDQFSQSVIASHEGAKQSQDQANLQAETKTLLNYFLVGVSLPDDTFWVNLRPDSENQIIDPWLEETDVGKIMLESDLQLKKDTARMTSPETPEGREYWRRLYKKAEELYSYNTATIPTLTRPWIVPGEIIVRETNDSAYVYKATLKVMLEQDYLKGSAAYNFKDERSKALNEYSSQLIRELIIPKLSKEVNSSKRYAALRQVYYSLILSRWFKLRFSGKTGTYASLINTSNLANLISQQSWSKTTYFKQYQKSFAGGEYNVKEPVYTSTGQVIRSYFSGGLDLVKGMDVQSNSQVGVFNGSNSVLPQIPNTVSFEGNLKGELVIPRPSVSEGVPSATKTTDKARGAASPVTVKEINMARNLNNKVKKALSLAADRMIFSIIYWTLKEFDSKAWEEYRWIDIKQDSRDYLKSILNERSTTNLLLARATAFLNSDKLQEIVRSRIEEVGRMPSIFQLEGLGRVDTSNLGPGDRAAVKELKPILTEAMASYLRENGESLLRKLIAHQKRYSLVKKILPFRAGFSRKTIDEYVNRAIEKITSAEIQISTVASPLETSTSSAVQAVPEKTGGIDFRALPMTIQPMGSFSGLNFNLPQLSRAELERINIDSEMQQISNMVQAGILPSGERIKELVAACVQKGQIKRCADGLLLCFIDICNLQEENAYESSPEFREALVIVDSQA